jgi:hypothetical protein
VTRTIIDASYEPDPDPAIRNPERGIYYWPGAGAGYHTLIAEWLYLGSVGNQDLRWAGHGHPATSPVLDAYADRLEAHRRVGTKILFRPRYDVAAADTLAGSCCGVFHADSKLRQLAHIDAIAALLGDFRDVVAFIEAGYLGRWGEWNTYGYEPSAAPLLYATADRNEVIDHVLRMYAAHGLHQHVQLRRPVFAKEALDRNPAARVGLHDDSFMTDAGDLDTYDNFEPDHPSGFASLAHAKAWAHALTERASFGGETCPYPIAAERWRTCSNMIGAGSEPAALHMSYLHGGYAEAAKPAWVASGCYDEIRRRLGYRFELRRIEYVPIISTGQRFEIVVDVANTGWARLHKPRQAMLVLRSDEAAHAFAVTPGDVASWAPGETVRLVASADAPRPGVYSIRLAIPDPDAPTGSAYARTRIAYAVRLASLRAGASVFDATTGENVLGVSMTVR